MIRQILIAAGLVLAAAAAALAVNAVRPDPLPLVQDWDAVMAARAESKLPGGVEAIGLKTMAELYRNEKVVVLDARPRDFFLFERIPGARSFPLEEADTLIPDLLKSLPDDVRIVTYCDGASCPKARELSGLLVQAGHRNVAVFIGGMEEWSMEGLPVAEGEDG